MKPFAKNLREYRKIFEFSQQQIADIIGIPRTRYQSYEEGRACPQLEDYAEMVQKLNISEPIEFISDEHYFDRKTKKSISNLSQIELNYLKLRGASKMAVDALLGAS